MWNTSSTYSARNATKEWCFGKAESDLVGHGTINDESDRSAFIILGLLSRNSGVHTKQSTIKIVEKTPREMWTGKKPSLSFLKIWGCEAFVKRLQSDKLTAKSDKCIFVGYPRETLGYYFYNREEGKVFVARNGVFLEKEFLSRGVSGSTVQLEEIREEPARSESAKTLEVESIEPAEAPILRRSTRL